MPLGTHEALNVRLYRSEHMKPWTQVVRFMTSTINPRGCLGERTETIVRT